METWYEKALIPYVYCRLARLFSYNDVNDPQKSAAAANGQFVMIRRDAYEAVGGHASVAGEILEDVALAMASQAGWISIVVREWARDCAGTNVSDVSFDVARMEEESVSTDWQRSGGVS